MKSPRMTTLYRVVGAVRRGNRIPASRCVAALRNLLGERAGDLSDKEIRSCVRQLEEAGVLRRYSTLARRRITNYDTGAVREYRRMMRFLTLRNVNFQIEDES